MSNDTWHHIAYTADGVNQPRLYIDGAEVGTAQSNNNTYYTSSEALDIGHFAGVAAYNYEGKIDQVRIFTKALSSSEVSTLYAETVDTVESLDPLNVDTTDTLQVLGDSSCVATYRFENDEVDLSGNYDGTGTAIQYAAGRYGQAASFGSNSKVQLPSGSPFNDSDTIKSISGWVKADTTSSSYLTLSIGSCKI